MKINVSAYIRAIILTIVTPSLAFAQTDNSQCNNALSTAKEFCSKSAADAGLRICIEKKLIVESAAYADLSTCIEKNERKLGAEVAVDVLHQKLVAIGNDCFGLWRKTRSICGEDIDASVDNCVLERIDATCGNRYKVDNSPENRKLLSARNIEELRAAIDNGANLKIVGDSALTTAASKHQRDMIQLLLSAGAKLDPPAKGKSDALFDAITGRKDEEEVQLLLLAEANPNPPNWLYSPLELAFRLRLIGAVKALVGAGANVNKRGAAGDYPISYAVGYGKIEIVKIMIAAGANVNVRGPGDGTTPLHDAANKGNIEIVRLLLDSGSDPDAVTYFGKKAVDYVPPENTQLIQLLRRR